MRKLTGIIFILISVYARGQDPSQAIFSRKFTPTQLQEDFSLFRQSLEKMHPGIYRYTTRQAMDSIFNTAFENWGSQWSIKTSINYWH